MPRLRLKLLFIVFCAVCTVPVFAQAVDHDVNEHESSEHESDATHESAHALHKNVLSLGVGYERLLNEKFYIAPGIEDSDAHGSESLVRLSAEYAFEKGAWEISPQLAVDFVDGEEVLILGVVFGKGF